jgi:UPF0042 nucleotide-binding protein
MVEPIRFVIITGLSGAGKSEAARSFEDLGYFVIDNLPPTLIPKFAELCAQSDGKINKIALVIDIRGGEFFDSLAEALDQLEATGFRYDILFLEASDEVLLRRFKDTRRRHPLAPTGNLLEGIAAERERLGDLRGRATKIIDTSRINSHQLKQEILDSFLLASPALRMPIRVVSFGYKYGLPLDADLVFDVRFLPNPHYVEELRPHTGAEVEVRDYVMKWPVTKEYIKRLTQFVDYLAPHFIKEGKTQLVIGVGCTGGRHRSVALANALGEFLVAKGYAAMVEHRDMSK